MRCFCSLEGIGSSRVGHFYGSARRQLAGGGFRGGSVSTGSAAACDDRSAVLPNGTAIRQDSATQRNRRSTDERPRIASLSRLLVPLLMPLPLRFLCCTTVVFLQTGQRVLRARLAVPSALRNTLSITFFSYYSTHFHSMGSHQAIRQLTLSKEAVRRAFAPL